MKLNAKEFEKMAAIYERARVVAMLNVSAEERQNGMECIPSEKVFEKLRKNNAERI